MEPTNEPSPADGDKKVEQQVATNFDEMYKQILKKEQDEHDNKLRTDATQEYEKVRNLGFATKKDIEETIGKFAAEVKTLREENDKLREWVMRAKARGLAGGATDDKPKEDNLLKAHDRFRW